MLSKSEKKGEIGKRVPEFAFMEGKPFVVLRTLSDKADAEAQESYLNFSDLAADQSSTIVMKMLESL